MVSQAGSGAQNRGRDPKPRQRQAGVVQAVGRTPRYPVHHLHAGRQAGRQEQQPRQVENVQAE